MAESIVELGANFTPSILVGPPTSLTFDVDEGRGYSLSQVVYLTNNGTYGSVLTSSITPSASYVRVSPNTVGNLAINETGQFSVEVTSTDLLASESPYSETIAIQDSTASNNPQSIPVVINVRPKSTISTNVTALVFTVVRGIDGTFPSIPTQTFTVQNTGVGGSVLEFDIRALTGLCSNWLRSWLPSSGYLTSGQSQSVVATVQPTDNMLQGTYSEYLRVSGYSSNSYIDVEVRLVIS
jgi:hypothetical protein